MKRTLLAIAITAASVSAFAENAGSDHRVASDSTTQLKESAKAAAPSDVKTYRITGEIFIPFARPIKPKHEEPKK